MANNKAESPAKVDYQKLQKQLYQPKTTPALVQVPQMAFIMVDGTGAPEGEAYQNAIAVLYALSYTIKMSKKGPEKLEGYFEYSMMPLEGLWQNISFDGGGNRDAWGWTSMIRQPDFVTPEIFAWALERAAAKKPELDFSAARLEHWEEGSCAQLMHFGPYSAEGPSMAKLEAFIAAEGLVADYTPARRHHELYLGDPRRTAPEKCKTILRTPVKKA